ncbi:MAG: dCTP deaminase [Chloroflexi bacterium]|nr:dCTP deaminase [Chloroflexota bacterium]
MVLSDRTIKEEIAKGRIVIDPPLDESCIQPASVDVHLGSTFRVFRPWKSPYYIDLKQPLDGLTDEVTVSENDYFALQPGQFVLGATKEYIGVPDDLMARLEGKSSLGRIGLLVHATAGYVDPGWRGRLTLELSNVSSLPIHLYPGMKISQISFYRLTTPAERPYGSPGLGSKYQGQTGPTPTRVHMDFHQPALLTMPSIPVQAAPKRRQRDGRVLRDWLKQSEFQGSPKRLAEALSVPQKTVEDWVYRGARPNPAHRAKVFQVTRLPEFRVAAPSGKPAPLLD